MKEPNRPHAKPHGRGRPKLLCALASLAAASLLMAGCSRVVNTGNRGNASNKAGAGNAGNASNANASAADDEKSRERIKGMADQQGRATAPDKGNFKVDFAAPKNQKYVKIYEELRSSDSLDRMADELNAAVAIPEDVNIGFKECGKASAWWDPKTRSITICYELIDDSAERLKTIAKGDRELEDAVGGATAFVFVHELGHSMIDLLKLPPSGKLEESVDQVATYVLADGEGDEGEKMALLGSTWWGRKYDELIKGGDAGGHLNQAWADEHSFNSQRFYNIMCWVFGHDPGKFQRIVNDPLPEARAVRCEQEYQRLTGTWAASLKPYLKSGGAADAGQ